MKALVPSSPMLRASRLLVAAGLAWTVLAGLAVGDSAARRTSALADDYRVVIGSNRDGVTRAYSIFPDGSRLTPLLAGGRRLVPIVVSRDGETVAYATTSYATTPYVTDGPIYVSRASGRGLRRLVKDIVYGPTLSRDGKWLAFSPEDGVVSIVRSDGRSRRSLLRRCSCAVYDWSPNGKTLVLEGPQRVVVLPLNGKRRVVARSGENSGQHRDSDGASWSPDGRWIAYLNLEDNDKKIGLYLVRPNGKRLHRIVRGAVITVAWSPNGKELAFTFENGQLAVVGVDGRRLRRLPLEAFAQDVKWSPDGQRLAVAASSGDDRAQIFVVAADGSGSRRVTAEGENSLAGWTSRAPAQPPASPIPATERILDTRSVATTAPVRALSADGTRVAFVPKVTTADCEHTAAWAPGEDPIARFVLPAPCPPESYATVREVALSGSRVAWTPYRSEGDGECSFQLKSATLTNPQPLWLHGVGGASRRSCVPDYYHLRGDGDLFVANDGQLLVRIGGGRETCYESGAKICATLRRGANAGPVDSVSGGLIAVRKPGSVVVLDDDGRLVRQFPFSPADVRAARLDGGRLVVWRFGVLEAYEVATGVLVRSHPVPAGSRLVDMDGGVAVLLGGETITLLRLDDGASRTLSPGRGPVLADLEPPGLYYSYATGGGGRVVFMPRSEADPARSAA